MFPQSLWEHTRSAVKQVPTSIVVAGFPTKLAVAGIPTRRVVAIFPTTSLVGRLPQQGLWDWHTIGNLASAHQDIDIDHYISSECMCTS